MLVKVNHFTIIIGSTIASWQVERFIVMLLVHGGYCE